MATKDQVLTAIQDLVADFLYYDRKEDEDLPMDEIERLVEEGELSIDEMVDEFQRALEDGLDMSEDEDEE